MKDVVRRECCDATRRVQFPAGRARSWGALAQSALRRFLPVVGLSIALAGQIRAEEESDVWPWLETVFASAFEDYDSTRDVGVQLEGPGEITHSRYGEWSFVFRAGSDGIPEGGSVAVATRHVSGWGATQHSDPEGPNYVTVKARPGLEIRLDTQDGFQIFNKFFYEYFPWQHLTLATVTRGSVGPGEKVTLIFGDRSSGSPGYRAPAVARQHAAFLAFFRRSPQEQFQAIPARLSVATLAAEPASLRLTIPSDLLVEEPFRLIVSVEDDQGNAVAGYSGSVRLDGAALAGLPETLSFRAADRGVVHVNGVRCLSAETIRITADDSESGLSGKSNPGRCAAERPSRRVLWGDFHSHSAVSDGTDSPRDLYHYARDVAGLDFFAVTDHGYQMNEIAWDKNEQVTTAFHDPPHFSTFFGYEWSGMTDVGGDHNIIYSRSDLPLLRSNSYYEPKNPFIYSGADLDAPHIVQLYKWFRRMGKEEQSAILAFPSIRGRRPNPRWNDSQFSPVVEVISEAGWFEDLGLAFLREGHRVGFVASGDDHYGRPGHGIADRPQATYQERSLPAGRNRMVYPWGQAAVGSPIMAVLAEKNDRQSIFEALFARRCYATSGARLLLDFSADGKPMGTAFAPTDSPLFHIQVEGSAPITAVLFKKDGETVLRKSFSGETLQLEFTHREESDFKGHFYYVVVDQADGNRAISSPIWLD